MQIWKNINSQKIKTLGRVKGLDNSVRKTLANAIAILSLLLSGNSLRPFSNSHQHSYFELKVLAGLNQERAKFCF